MAARARRREPAAMPYRYMIVGEDGLIAPEEARAAIVGALSRLSAAAQ